ncbi:radical SAM protein [Acidipila sp. EB88]|uniref:radical SAM protein n=1 Tax=Acidipila sp. EB88 TaxID=2305226 RepID=UPI000F5F2EA2|nr:radical SAM protein [Acidipila sp. EB88]RRA48628.1 radical SAM protein [Acidipila sp. EB88]
MFLIETYKSVQGESSFAGVPCIFVRLAGCNLRCSWCDSEYTFTGGYKQSADEVIAAVEALAPVRLVEFTGGEPLLQARELIPVMERLLADGYQLMIETSGERPLSDVPPAVHKIVDVKCPASGECGRFRLDNLDTLTARDEAKFVISDRADYEFARDFTLEHSLHTRAGHVLFSPAFKKAPSLERSTANCALDPRQLVDWMLADAVPARLSLQIHKYIWEPQKKGV